LQVRGWKEEALGPAPEDVTGAAVEVVQLDAAGRRPVAQEGFAGRLGRALAAAGIAPEALETRITATSDAVDVWLVRDPRREVTLEQLVVITSILRSGDRSGRLITAGVI
jgi:hypothetical protein